ncbi:MAG: hypothetical protein AAGO57_01120 [Pseudomonadota bacterium]
MPRKLATLWIGDTLGQIEQISARSFLDTGHQLTIYAYEPMGGIPEGAEVRNAASIFDVAPILRYKNGSPSLHSNLFRYALMEKTDQVWVDLDIVALRAFEFDTDHIYGMETEDLVNGAVLRLPKGSKTLERLAKYTPDTRGYHPNAGPIGRAWAKFITGGKGQTLADWGWGATGPRALTKHLKETGEIAHALPTEAFYPVHWKDVRRLIEKGGIDRSGLADASFAVHLWGFHLARAMKRRGGGFHPNSFIGETERGLLPRDIFRAVPK